MNFTALPSAIKNLKKQTDYLAPPPLPDKNRSSHLWDMWFESLWQKLRDVPGSIPNTAGWGDGTDGTSGSQGPIGLPGDPGAPGTDGTSGTDGTDGDDGIKRVTGLIGSTWYRIARTTDTNAQGTFKILWASSEHQGGLNMQAQTVQGGVPQISVTQQDYV